MRSHVGKYEELLGKISQIYLVSERKESALIGELSQMIRLPEKEPKFPSAQLTSHV